MTDNNMFADAVGREYLLAAAKYQDRLKQNDMESIVDIAQRLRQQVEAARKNTDAKKPTTDAPIFDASAHRPGWRLSSQIADSASWRHDRRRKKTTEMFDPEGREQATFVSTEEEDGEDDPEKALSDAYKQYKMDLCSAYKRGR